MNIKVRYYSKGGNTKKLAECIARAAGVQAAAIENGAAEQADILFLGASVYCGGIDSKVKSYIESLDPKKIKEAVIFSTSALTQRAFPEIRKRLEKKGIKTSGENFYCRGEFSFLHKGRPDANDLKAAEQFAQNILKKRS